MRPQPQSPERSRAERERSSAHERSAAHTTRARQSQPVVRSNAQTRVRAGDAAKQKQERLGVSPSRAQARGTSLPACRIRTDHSTESFVEKQGHHYSLLVLMAGDRGRGPVERFRH